MKTLWYIQENLNQDDRTLLPVLDKLEIDYTLFQVIPFSDSIPDIVYEEPIIVRGSTTTLINAKKKNWVPGVWHNDNFKPSYYNDQLGSDYINGDGHLEKLGDLGFLDRYDDLFVRPNSDLKEFSGILMSREERKNFYATVKRGGFPFDLDLDVWVAPPKNYFDTEARFVVIDGKMVSGTIYKERNNHCSIVIPPIHFEPMEKFIIDLGEDVYCMDIAGYGYKGREFKVLEYGCFNASGLYGDHETIVKSVTNFVEEKYSTF